MAYRVPRRFITAPDEPPPYGLVVLSFVGHTLFLLMATTLSTYLAAQADQSKIYIVNLVPAAAPFGSPTPQVAPRPARALEPAPPRREAAPRPPAKPEAPPAREAAPPKPEKPAEVARATPPRPAELARATPSRPAGTCTPMGRRRPDGFSAS